jgi:hypothetical protein
VNIPAGIFAPGSEGRPRQEPEGRAAVARRATEPPQGPTAKPGRPECDRTLVVDHALYWVPDGIKEVVQLCVRRDRQTVKVYQRAVLVKVHATTAPGGASIDPSDLPLGKAVLATRNSGALCEKADGFGPQVGDYARRLADEPIPWSRMRHVYRLLGLAQRFGGAAVNEACARALELDVIDVKRVQGMLENGLPTRNPMMLAVKRASNHRVCC